MSHPCQNNRSAPSLQAGVATYEALIAQLREINGEMLAVAAELADGTIETVLAKSHLELGIEALMRGMQP